MDRDRPDHWVSEISLVRELIIQNYFANWIDWLFETIRLVYESDIVMCQGDLGWRSRFHIHKMILYCIVCVKEVSHSLSFPGFVAEQFLNSTATQLTYHGLCELTSTVQEGELCVFFRNNHFSTMTKFKVFTFKCYFCSVLRWWMLKDGSVLLWISTPIMKLSLRVCWCPPVANNRNLNGYREDYKYGIPNYHDLASLKGQGLPIITCK